MNAYAIYFGYWAVYIPCLLELTLICILTILKAIYDRRNGIPARFDLSIHGSDGGSSHGRRSSLRSNSYRTGSMSYIVPQPHHISPDASPRETIKSIVQTDEESGVEKGDGDPSELE